MALPKISKRTCREGQKWLENPGIDLFAGDQLDGLLCMHDLDTTWLAGFRSVSCQPGGCIIFCIRFNARMGQVHYTLISCAIKSDDDLSLRAIWDHPGSNYIQLVKVKSCGPISPQL